MSNQNTISVQLTVKDDGSVVMKQFGRTTEEEMGKAGNSAKKTTSSFDTLKSSYLDMAAKAATAYMAIQKAMEYMDKGAKASQAEASFRTLAASSGESADQIIANMKRATNSTIDDSQMMQKASKAMMLEFTGDQIEKMSEMARIGARTTGENVSQVFDVIVDGISTNMPRALKRYGVITKEQMGTISQAMAEGVEDVNLFSVAQANLADQQAKMGPLFENEAEKLQQFRAEIEDTKESVGKLLLLIEGFTLDKISKVTGMYASAAASMATGSLEPFRSWQVDLSADEVGLEEAQKERDRYNARLKAAQQGKQDTGLSKLGDVAREKADLETMQALNKDYFASRETQIKAMGEFKKATGEDEYKIAGDSLKKQEELNAEYYTRMKQEIESAAAVRSKSDRDKISDAVFTAQQMQALDEATTNKAKALIQQRTIASVQAAQNDIKNLTSRLSEYQTYYDSLKAMMDKNTADEKAHQEELQTLRQQSIDLEKSTASLIAGIKGPDQSLSAQQQYENARSALNAQYGNALNLSGQDEIKALEAYKQAVAALQQQYAKGIPGVADIFGKAGDILSAKTIAEDALSDIERATQNQKNALAELTAEKQNQIAVDQLAGQQLQEEAIKSQGEIEKLKTLMADLSAQIQGMQKTIELTGIDNVSGVVNSIMARMEALHALAAQPINIGGGSSSGYSSLSAGSDGFTDIPFTLGSGVIDSYASGTDYVPRTGNYQLHQGEAVIPAAQNNNSRSMSIGALHINIPANAAPQSKEDWRAITRNYIVPELRKLNA
ncbi:hypothetical protein ER57_03190 [Smithella sp. SCADC]|jgi:hypothetical protein|nr:hypothetical protein ER57_03190 [Smithella sp. SCADC]